MFHALLSIEMEIDCDPDEMQMPNDNFLGN